jgi:hypothetical protein
MKSGTAPMGIASRVTATLPSAAALGDTSNEYGLRLQQKKKQIKFMMSQDLVYENKNSQKAINKSIGK